VNIIKCFELTESESLVLVGFLNQLTIYKIKVESMAAGSLIESKAYLVRQVVLEDIKEDLRVVDVITTTYLKKEFLQLAFAGALGVIYVDHINSLQW